MPPVSMIRIDGETHPFEDIHSFRARYALPDAFSIRAFEGKDYHGLGSMEHASAEMNRLRAGVLDAIPATLTRAGLPAFLPVLSAHFRVQMIEINDKIKLHAPEVDFAGAGFSDALHTFLYALFSHRTLHLTEQDIDTIYRRWLDDSLRITVTPHPYTHTVNGQLVEWQVRVVNNIYGRIGLQVTLPDELVYVRDTTYTCPAEGFMSSLIRQVYGRIIERLTD